MHEVDHHRADGLMLHTNTSELCGVLNTTARAGHEDICRAITEELHHVRSLPEFGANDYCVADGSSCTGDGSGHFNDTGASSS